MGRRFFFLLLLLLRDSRAKSGDNNHSFDPVPGLFMVVVWGLARTACEDPEA